MDSLSGYEKPKTVTYAELALWAWTAWTCLFGFFQTRGQIPEIGQALDAAGLQDVISIAPGTMLRAAAGGYAVLALISAWFIIKIGAGKPWARSSFLWGFLFQILFMAFPPYQLGDLPAAIPDLGLQIYALYLLYTRPGSDWFQKRP